MSQVLNGRLLSMSYEATNTGAEPYTKMVEELPRMRRDTVELMKKAVSFAGRLDCWLVAILTQKRMTLSDT